MLLDWARLSTKQANRIDGQWIEIEGWIAPFQAEAEHSYFLLVQDMVCCFACRPTDPERCIEVIAGTPIPRQSGAVTIAGRFHALHDDPAGWKFQLRDAVLIGAARPVARITEISRRAFVAMGAALPIGAAWPTGGPGAARPSLPWRLVTAGMGEEEARRLLSGMTTIDVHSHAGNILRFSSATEFGDVAADMRRGKMAVICLAMVADGPVARVMPDKRIQAYRSVEPGELYRWSQRVFARIAALAANQGLRVVTQAGDLQIATTASIIVAAEGGDFLDTSIGRLEEAFVKHRLRHLQLTHYRVNELGDIQTEDPVHGGLTAFGAEVVRACNRLGIVVDVAHGTYDLVKRAASITSKPLVLSHTSLASRPGPRSRQIDVDHARLIAATNGVIGVWPVAEIFKDLAGYATGFARMVDAIGIDHVGLGSDMRGLVGASLLDSYADLPYLAMALSARGFNGEEIAKLLGGNYRRVFAQTVGATS